MTTDSDDDFLAELGVTMPPTAPKADKPAREAKAKVRFVEWSNIHNFEHGGYLARVRRHTCELCENLWDELEGVFIEEIHRPSHTRRLTPLPVGSQFPVGNKMRKEVTQVTDPVCGNCIGGLGFDQEVDAGTLPYTLVVGVGRVGP